MCEVCDITLLFLLQGVKPISTPRMALYALFDPGPTAIDAASRDGTTTEEGETGLGERHKLNMSRKREKLL